jgi:hypothetical protein
MLPPIPYAIANPPPYLLRSFKFQSQYFTSILYSSTRILLLLSSTLSTAKMRSLFALPIILLSSLALASPLEERAACSQCKPFPTPGDNSQQCDQSTTCVTQPGARNYCACRGGYRGSGGYSPGDTGVQVSLIIQTPFSEYYQWRTEPQDWEDSLRTTC